MKILHVISGTTAQAGIPTAMLDHVLALRERDVEQVVLCRLYADFLEPLRDAGIPLRTFDYNKWNKWFVDLATRKNIRRMVNSDAIDVIHCWGEKSATFVPRTAGVPSLGWDVGFGGYDLKREAVCDYYMGVNHGIVEEIREQTGRPDCVFLGHAFGDLKEEPPLSREEFGIPEGRPVILMLARMHQEKGVDMLLYAALKVDAFLLLAGTGPELETYRALARNLGVESRVCFTGWRSERSSLLELADILAVPSRIDPCPAVMSQAWQKSVPLVASNADGLGEYIQHGVNGMSSNIEDVDGLARNLRVVLEDADLRKRLIAGGTHTYKTQFSKKVVIDNLLKIYEEIVRRGVIENK